MTISVEQSTGNETSILPSKKSSKLQSKIQSKRLSSVEADDENLMFKPEFMGPISIRSSMKLLGQ